MNLDESIFLTLYSTTKLQLPREYDTGIKNRNIGQGNKIESQEVNPHTSAYLIFDKGGKNIQ